MGNEGVIPPHYLNAVVTGDARELANDIPDNSIDLIFTDPVYQCVADYEWLAYTANRVLKPNCALLAFIGTGYLDSTLSTLCAHLGYRWTLTANYAMRKKFYGRLQVSMTVCLWMEKGRSKLYAPVGDSTTLPFQRDVRYLQADGSSWDKHPKIVKRYIEGFTQQGGIVFDPFCGTGTIPAYCKQLGRNYIGVEINGITADTARQRVLNTQPPLPLVYDNQLTFNLDT